MMRQARAARVMLMGRGTRTVPLNKARLWRKMGLAPLAVQLRTMASRPVNFKVYSSLEAALKRGPTWVVP